jgi:hypothetical protein
MENNQAFIGELIHIQPIDGADRIVSASVSVDGVTPITNVVVGKETQEHDKIVYFDSNMCLNEETILKDYPELARYLGKHGRVKTIKLKGVYSDGLVVPVDKFERYDKSAPTWSLGVSFTEISGTPICHKYVPPAPKVARTGSKTKKGKISKSRMVPEVWHFHVDTEQFARNIDRIHPEDVISISRKIHGTSAICSYNLVWRKLSWRDRFARLLGVAVQDTEYDYLYSSRRVVKNGLITEDTGYYSTDIWTEAGKKYFGGKLAKGETVYFEIVGYQLSGQWIQKLYDYGCLPGQYKIAVYRITKTSPDGHVTEYSWNTMKERCAELGVPMVEEYFYGRAQDLYPFATENIAEWRANILEFLRGEYLERTVKENLNGKIPDEGIVIRKDHGKIEVYKLKSLAFLEKETALYSEGAENIEDES